MEPSQQAIGSPTIAREAVLAVHARSADIAVARALLPMLPPLPGPPAPIAAPVRATHDPAPGVSHWSGSAWSILRGRGSAGVATPQLGGSQAGLRVAYTQGRLALTGRIARAVGTPQQEGAIGIEWHPAALPVRLIAEQRIGIVDARGGPSIGLVSGIGQVALPRGVALDGYVQAGMIARSGIEGYADGALRAGAVVARSGPVWLDLGLGAWGAVQRGAGRMDLGPSAAMTLPVGGQRVRLSLDWRQRVAGEARPGSGVALTMGTDF